jgi:hypothetical protein
MAPLEELIGERWVEDVLPDPWIHAALDEIDFGELRIFLETVGGVRK